MIAYGRDKMGALMADILVRDVDSKTLSRLKARAKRNKRSLQSEAKSILEAASGYSEVEARRVLRQWQTKLKGRRVSDGARLLDEDRRR